VAEAVTEATRLIGVIAHTPRAESVRAREAETGGVHAHRLGVNHPGSVLRDALIPRTRTSGGRLEVGEDPMAIVIGD
jgi:hypothetical protein